MIIEEVHRNRSSGFRVKSEETDKFGDNFFKKVAKHTRSIVFVAAILREATIENFVRSH